MKPHSSETVKKTPFLMCLRVMDQDDTHDYEDTTLYY